MYAQEFEYYALINHDITAQNIPLYQCVNHGHKSHGVPDSIHPGP